MLCAVVSMVYIHECKCNWKNVHATGGCARVRTRTQAGVEPNTSWWCMWFVPSCHSAMSHKVAIAILYALSLFLSLSLSLSLWQIFCRSIQKSQLHRNYSIRRPSKTAGITNRKNSINKMQKQIHPLDRYIICDVVIIMRDDVCVHDMHTCNRTVIIN